ncbi:hypothetical protein ABZ756_02360 [Mammaliicoccus sciuri]
MAGKQKKPIFKKWWVWLIVVLIVGSIGNLIGGKEITEEPKKVETFSTSDEIDKEDEMHSKKEEGLPPEDSLKESEMDANQLEELKKSFEQLITESDGLLLNIEPFEDDWNHVRVTVNESLSKADKESKQELIDNVSLEIRNNINGYIGTGDVNFFPFLTFSYFDGSTMAESSMLDKSNIKVK